MRRSVFALLAATIALLVTPALWLGIYQLARQPLPIGALPELHPPPAIQPAAADSAIRMVSEDEDMVERVLIRAAFDLIPPNVLPEANERQNWRFRWTPEQADVHGPRPMPQLFAVRSSRPCSAPECRDHRGLIARLQLIASGAASAQVMVEWLVYGDSTKRGMGRIIMRRSGDSWRLAAFEQLEAPQAPKDPAEFLQRLIAPTPLFR